MAAQASAASALREPMSDTVDRWNSPNTAQTPTGAAARGLASGAFR